MPRSPLADITDSAGGTGRAIAVARMKRKSAFGSFGPSGVSVREDRPSGFLLQNFTGLV
ncbi:MAG: hypothetical protein ACE5GH_03310 [Fidelibacterota bacterium]